MSDELQRDIGRMEGEMTALKDLLAEMRTDLKELKDTMHQMKGGTRVFLGLAAVAGSGLTVLINWFIGKH